MTFASNFQMPGAFYFESQPSGVHPGIFRPPISPSASSSAYLSKSTGSVQSESVTGAAGGAAPGASGPASRKRPRDWHDRDSTPLHEWADAASMTPATGDARQSSGGGCEPQYFLAGQIDTPSGVVNAPPFSENGILDYSLYSDVDYRRDLGSKRPQPRDEPAESPASRHTTLVRPQLNAGDGWSRLALSTIGGVVGRVWEFCKEGAFRGFFAGEGRGFSLPPSQPSSQNQQHKSSGWYQENDMPTLNASEVVLPSVPGTFPSDTDYMTSYGQSPQHQDRVRSPEPTPSRPAAKRRQISENDELRRNWVMVDEPAPTSRRRTMAGPAARAQPPSRNTRPSMGTGRRINVPVSRLNTTPGMPRRHSNRISHAGSPSLSAHEPASFAAPRSPRAASPAVASPSRIPVPSRPGSSHGMNPFSGRKSTAPSSSAPAAISTSTSHRRTHSGASAASARGPTTTLEEDIEASPRLNTEAKQLAARRLKEERDADVRMATMNARLKEMIRQGKEALGTTIEIDGGENGWEDDDE